MQNHTIGKKIGGKSAIKQKDGVQNQKGGKKKRGCKIAQLAKDRGKVQLSLSLTQ